LECSLLKLVLADGAKLLLEPPMTAQHVIAT
jgi:hypothetical protein